MEKIKVNYKNLLKCFIITILSIGYIMFTFIFLLFLIFPLEWSTVTNLVRVICFLTQLPVFIYCIFYIQKNKIKMSIALILLFILLWATPYIVFTGEKYICSNFTPSRWHRRVKSRFLMFDDMLVKNKLMAKDKNEILELLGTETPSEDVLINVTKVPYKEYLVYYLGKSVDGVFHTEDDYLVIYFKNSIVEKHTILTDTFDF